MATLFFYCAAAGGLVLVVQMLLLLFGGGADADVDGDVHLDGDVADAFFKALSLKTLVSFFTFFGLGGMLGQEMGLPKLPTLMIALFAGGMALYLVAWMMAGLARLQSKGNVELRNAVGRSGKVYLRIPAHLEGPGKVTVAVQGRTVEVKAVTAGDGLETGSLVKVVGIPAPDTLEVVHYEEA